MDAKQAYEHQLQMLEVYKRDFEDARAALIRLRKQNEQDTSDLESGV
jgi:hypothetical protein